MLILEINEKWKHEIFLRKINFNYHNEKYCFRWKKMIEKKSINGSYILKEYYKLSYLTNRSAIACICSKMHGI